MKNEIEKQIFEKMKAKDSVESMCNETKLNVLKWTMQQLRKHAVSGSLRFSEFEVDFAYLCGIFNTSGIDGLRTEIQRLKEIGKEPHDIIEARRKQRTNLSI